MPGGLPLIAQIELTEIGAVFKPVASCAITRMLRVNYAADSADRNNTVYKKSSVGLCESSFLLLEYSISSFLSSTQLKPEVAFN